MRRRGLSVFWGTSGISIRMPTIDVGPDLPIAWAHPTGVSDEWT
jgi:hypothetical protein